MKDILVQEEKTLFHFFNMIIYMYCTPETKSSSESIYKECVFVFQISRLG